MKKLINIFFIISFGQAFATNYYVNPLTGNDLDDGLSSVNAKATLQDIFDSYNLGSSDIIYCESGTYNETDVRPGSNDEGFTIQGDGEGLTIFDGSSSDGWLYLSYSNNDNIKIYDITVQNYKQAWGGGLYSTAAVTGTTFTDVTFDNCDATSGGGGFVISNTDNQSLTASNCTFKNCDGTGYDDDFGAYYVNATGTFDFTSCTFHTNHGYDGGALGIYDGTNTFNKCTFYNNDADDDGAVLYCIGGTYSFENCLFYENTAGSGEVLYSGSSDGTCEIRHCTIVDNTTYGVSHTYAGTLNIYSCIIQDNTSSDIYTSSATLNVYNTIYNTRGGYSFDVDSNNETTDATFTDKANDDYTLDSSSNGIDEGYVSGAPSDDLAGNSRDATPDMGCYEALSNEWTGAVSTAWTNTGNWSLGTVPTSSDAVTIPDVTNQPEITSVVTLAGLTIASGADITLSNNSLTVTGTLDLNGTMYIDNATVNADGTFDAAGGEIDFTNANGKLILSSDVTSLGTLDTAMGTVEYDGATQDVLGGDYYNLTLSTAGTKTADGAINVDGNLSTAATAGCKLDMGANALNIAGDLTVGATDGLDLSDDSALLTLDGSGSQTVTHAGNSPGTITENIFFDDFSSPDAGWTSGAISGTNSWATGVLQGAEEDPSTDYTSTNTDNKVYGQGMSASSGDGLSDYYDSSNEWLKTPVINCTNYTNVQLSFARHAYFESSYDESYVEISINNSTWTSLGEPLYPTDGSWTLRTIDISATADGQSTVYIRWRSNSDGSVAYGGWNIDDVTISGDTPNSGSEFTDITIDKAGGSVILNDEISVDGTITFTSGDIDASSNNLVLTANATVSGADDASHVIGSVAKTTTSTSQFTFPIGDGTNYRPIAVTPSNTDETTWTANYQNSAYGTLAVNVPLQAVSEVEYWNLDRSGTATAAITLWWDENSTVNDLSDLRVAHYNSGTSQWENAGNTATTGNTTSGSVTSDTDWDSYSPFTIGATSGTALPVTYLGMQANCTENGAVDLTWKTGSEQNSSHFDVERSRDGVNWTTVGTVQAAGNTATQTSYAYSDMVNDQNFEGYYRLRQVDMDGKATVFAPVSVFCSDFEMEGMDLYPNPGAEIVNVVVNQVHYHAYETNLRVVDMLGKIIYQEPVILNNGTTFLQLNVQTLPKGVYTVTISTAKQGFNKRLIVK